MNPLLCPACVAPLTVVPGAAVQQCSYCGVSVCVGSSLAPTDVLPFVSAEPSIRQAILDSARGRVDQLIVARVFIPALFASARAEGRWSAYFGTPYQRGGMKWTPRNGGPVKRTYRNHCLLPLQGRWSRAFDDLPQRALAAVPLHPSHLANATVLQLGGTPRQQEAAAEQELRRIHREEVQRAVPAGSRSFDCTIDIQDLHIQRVLVPLWAYECVRKGKSIRGFVDDATRRVSGMSQPWSRLWIAAACALVLAPLGLVFLCCGGLPEPHPPEPQLDVMSEIPQEAASSSAVRVTRRCDISAFDDAGQAVVIGEAEPGAIFEPIARDDHSVQIKVAGAPAWIPVRCVTP